VVRRQRSLKFRRRKTRYGVISDNVRIPRPEGSSNGFHALHHRYHVSTWAPNIRECEPGSARRIVLETRVLDGRAIGGWRIWLLAGFPDKYQGTKQEKAGEMAGKSFQRGGMSASSFYMLVLVPPTCPRGDGGPRLGEKSRREERLRPWGGAYGMRRRDRRATA
jgi:hypothetical protein